jgi:NTP pyrophosphatase (non-canonical NTP hydrolase)
MLEAIVATKTLCGDAQQGLTLNDYQAKALKADRKPQSSLAFPLLGLFGEVGTLLSVAKKKQRDAASYLVYAPHVIEEFGDVLWYFAVVAHRGGVQLSDIANNLGRGLADWALLAGNAVVVRDQAGATRSSFIRRVCYDKVNQYKLRGKIAH